MEMYSKFPWNVYQASLNGDVNDVNYQKPGVGNCPILGILDITL